MSSVLDADSLHRTAKYFMDNGQAQTYDQAMLTLRQFGLTIFVGQEITTSVHHQNALLTLVNVARRTFLGGVEVVGLPNAPSLSPLADVDCLRKAVAILGGVAVEEANTLWPAAVIGDASVPASPLPQWRLTWEGWRGGIVPLREGQRLHEHKAMVLAPIIAAAVCAAEAFAHHAADHVMAGRRALGLSVWRPGADWMVADPTEPLLAFLPSRLWLIGLGNVGQAFAWALACLRYPDSSKVKLILQDFDWIAASNESTSLLTFPTAIKRRKARVVSEWLEARGFVTYLNERRFGTWTRRGEDEPTVALCGVDNALARAALGDAGFGLIVEAGLGAGPEAFRSFSMHTFPSSRRPDEVWSRLVGAPDENFEAMPAYQALKRGGMDTCGLAKLASRTVGVPFVGVIAACLVVSELLRRLNGGFSLEVLSGSAAALGDIEMVCQPSEAYAFGHLPAANPERD